MRRTGVMLRALQAVALCAAIVLMVGAGDAGNSRFNRLGHQMMCVCGCGQVLLECNHFGCPDSGRMIDELQAQLAGGASDTMALNWFTGKYGPTVLAAPIRGGFDNVAWIAPVVVFLLATIGTGWTVWVWRRRTLRRAMGPGCGGVIGMDYGTEPRVDAESVDAEDEARRERIRRETEYR